MIIRSIASIASSYVSSPFPTVLLPSCGGGLRGNYIATWVESARFSAMRGHPACGAANVHTWLQPQERSTPRWPCRSSASWCTDAPTYGDLSRRCVSDAIADAIYLGSRSRVRDDLGFLNLDPHARVVRIARHADPFEFCISWERGKDCDATEHLVIVFPWR